MPRPQRQGACRGYAHVGAVLEQPGTGAILAMYSGPELTEPHRRCQRVLQRATWP